MSPGELAARVARAGRRPGALRTLLLDLDGTLAPIAPTPEAARVPAATLDALRRLIRAGWTVAVVSGRRRSEVRRLVPLRAARAFGSHGLEGSWNRAGGPRVPAGLRRRIARLAGTGRRLVARHPGARLERKPAGLAFHDRGVAAPALGAWRRALHGWLDRQRLDGLDVIRGKRVLELRPAGCDKGGVVRRLPGLARRRGPDGSVVAVGDDRTDEDMFRALGRRGTTIRVGRPGAPSRARHRLPSPRAVQRFVQTLAEHAEREPRA